jgi:hypothetical protein
LGDFRDNDVSNSQRVGQQRFARANIGFFGAANSSF